MMEIYVDELATGRAQLSGFLDPPQPGEMVKVVKREDRKVYDAYVRSVANVPNNPRGHHWEIEYELSLQTEPELYSNCVILDFQRPITRAQLEEIDRRLKLNKGADVGLPALRVNPTCGFKAGNSVIPTIAADDC